MILIQSDLGLFFGRFHALIVHLPIGFMLLGGCFYLLSRKASWRFLEKTLPLTFLLTSLGALIAVGMGLLLAEEGGYNEQILLRHRIFGLTTTLLSGILYLHFSGRFWRHKAIANWGLSIGILLLFITGHLGGQLTHGSDYLLEHAPSALRNVLGGQASKKQAYTYPLNPDSIFLYQHLIQPVFDRKCVHCHNSKQSRGGLNLQSKKGLLAGGDHGDALEKKGQQSPLLLHRVGLEMDNPKYMPTKGTPMNYAEIRLLEYWVNEGYNFDQAITDKVIPTEILQLIQANYGISDKRKSYAEIHQVTAAAPQYIEALRAKGFTINKLAQHSNFLEVIYRDSITCNLLQELIPIKAQITWLNLSKTKLDATCMESLQQFNNLTKLQLSQNPIDNNGLLFLQNLLHLESLNLFDTSIDEQGLLTLKNLNQLQHLYLGQTEVDSTASVQIQEQFPLAEIRFK
ncbi:MAG: c-type cytochrome domain-containing protein [Bacteroidota bacterium]